MSSGKIDLNKRLCLLTGWIVITAAVFLLPLSVFVRTALTQDDASYLLVIPFISAGVLFIERQKVFARISTGTSWSAGFLLLAGVAALASRLAGASLQLSASILSLALLWTAGFAFLFGKAAIRAGSFALLFLLLMIPPPNFLLDRVIYLLQAGSAWLTELFFNLSGVPVLREGMVFHLAGANIEVAKECSGIRSSMAMFILALLVVHLYLTSFWKKSLFVISGLFMMIFKNGVRIATLTLLSIYVDPGFLYGKLHHEGGVVFFLLGLLLLAPLFLFLRGGQALPASESHAPPVRT